MPAEVAVRALLDAGAQSGVFPGAELRVSSLDGDPTDSLLQASAGRLCLQPEGPRVGDRQARWDLASITKLFTTMATLRLVGRGALDLREDVGTIVGETGDGPHRGISVRQLLEHRSGLPAWAPLHETSVGQGVLKAALAIERSSAPGAEHRYSDIGFLVLSAVLRERSGLSISELIQAEVLGPLGLRDTGYRPVGTPLQDRLDRALRGEFAATEICPRRGLLCGEVHDFNSWALGGAAPHAGLFGTAADLSRFAHEVARADQGYLPGSLAAAIWATPSEPGTHHLGWDTISPLGSSAGALLSREARGHLGFTGTSLWIDPRRRISVVLLTNRVHPSRENSRIRAFRPTLHDAVVTFVDGLS